MSGSVRQSHVRCTYVHDRRAGHTSAVIDGDVQPVVGQSGRSIAASEGRDGEAGEAYRSGRAKLGAMLVVVRSAAASRQLVAESAHATFGSPP